MKTTTFKILGLLCFVFVNISFSQEVLTIDQLTLKALKLSPNLQISSSEYEAAQSRHDEAFSSYLPNVNLYAGGGILGSSNLLSTNNEIKNGTAIIGTLSVNQLLYDFGKTGGASDATNFESNAYLANYKQQLSDKKRDVKSAYYNVLKADNLIQVYKENVKLNEAQLYRSQKYFEAGIRTKIDVTDAKVELIKSKLGLNEANYNLQLAYAKLDEVIGCTKVHRNYKVYSEELDINNLDIQLLTYPLTLDEAIQYSYENRFSIKQEMQLIASSKATQKISSSEYYPSINASGDYTHQAVDKNLESIMPETQYTAMINFNWNLYEGGSTSARDKENFIQTNIAVSKLSLKKLEVKTEVTNAYINLNSVKDSVILSKSLLEASKEKFEQAGKRYEYGLSDYIELQQARQGYIDASSQLVINYYNYFDAIATLDNKIGK